MTARVGIGAGGVLVGLYGAWLLLDLGWSNLLATGTWLLGGVVLHDGVVGPVAVLAGLAAVALVPARVRPPVVAGLVVLATVTATAVPVLGRFGARPDNPTLLDRDYLVGWLVLAGLVALVTAGACVRRVRHDAGVPSAADEDD